MKKEILTYPKDKETLLKVSEEVKSIDEVKDLIQDMKDTLHAAGDDAAGLSAVQIGILKRVCIVHYDNQEIVMINPKITWTRKGPNGIKPFKEGCLSAPGVYVEVNRPQKVICQYTDENWELQEIGQGGWMSAIIQHELDHLDGHCEVFNAVQEN